MVLIFSMPHLPAEVVERREDPVEVVDQTGRAELRGDLREADQIGEQNGRLLDPVGDHDLAVVQSGDDLPGQDVAQQCLVFLALELDPLQVAALALAPALALQAGADPGAQQDRVERLGQVVLGARLDAADHAVGLLQARDHDHRDGVQALVRLEPLEHLEAVEIGHHQIEQDQVELLEREKLERAPAGLGAGHLVAVARQAAKQQVAVAGVVVDHQDPAGLLRPRIVRLDRLYGPDQIGDHAGECALVLAGNLGAARATREVDDHVDARQEALGFTEQGLEIGPQRGAALLV